MLLLLIFVSSCTLFSFFLFLSLLHFISLSLSLSHFLYLSLSLYLSFSLLLFFSLSLFFFSLSIFLFLYSISSFLSLLHSLSLLQSILHMVSWFRVILDEAHMIKDRSTSTAKAVFNLNSLNKWCLSGTPLQNRVGELYSLVRFLRVDPHAFYYCKRKDCNCKSLHYRYSSLMHLYRVTSDLNSLLDSNLVCLHFRFSLSRICTSIYSHHPLCAYTNWAIFYLFLDIPCSSSIHSLVDSYRRFSRGMCNECGHSAMQHFCHFNKHILNPIGRSGESHISRDPFIHPCFHPSTLQTHTL